jgi:hypothetical protein
MLRKILPLIAGASILATPTFATESPKEAAIKAFKNDTEVQSTSGFWAEDCKTSISKIKTKVVASTVISVGSKRTYDIAVVQQYLDQDEQIFGSIKGLYTIDTLNGDIRSVESSGISNILHADYCAEATQP